MDSLQMKFTVWNTAARLYTINIQKLLWSLLQISEFVKTINFYKECTFVSALSSDICLVTGF